MGVGSEAAGEKTHGSKKMRTELGRTRDSLKASLLWVPPFSGSHREIDLEQVREKRETAIYEAESTFCDFHQAAVVAQKKSKNLTACPLRSQDSSQNPAETHSRRQTGLLHQELGGGNLKRQEQMRRLGPRTQEARWDMFTHRPLSSQHTLQPRGSLLHVGSQLPTKI